MPGTPERSGRAGTGSDILVVIGCLLPVLAILVGGVSLGVHYAIRTPTSPYQVEFSASGATCTEDDSEDAELILDEDSGEVLSCGVLPPTDVSPGRARAAGAFAADEVGRVTELSRTRAADGGLSEGDRDAVERLAAEIGRENGHHKTSPTPWERVTWTVGLYGVIGGLALLIGLGLWAQYWGPRTGPQG